MTDESFDEYPDLRLDGSIQFDIDGETYRLRMPRLGELRRFKEAREELIRRVGEFAEGFRPKETELRNKLDEVSERLKTAEQDELAALGPELREATAAVREFSNQIVADSERFQQDETFRWVNEVVKILSRPRGSDVTAAKSLPDNPEDLPVWCSSLVTTSEWVSHWMTHPKRPGA